jgi:hypothetical protein
MRWHKVVFSPDDSIDPDRRNFHILISRLENGSRPEVSGLTIFRQVDLNPPIITYYFPKLEKHVHVFRSFRLQECEPPNRDFVQLYFGYEGDLDRYLPEPDKR